MKNNGKKDEVHSRKKYHDPSRSFHDWVVSHDLEKSRLGRIFLFLDRYLSFRRTVLLFLFSFFLSLILFSEIRLDDYDVRVGQQATRDYKSPISFEIIDEFATEAKRQEEEAAVPPVFDYNPEAYEDLFARISLAFGEMRKLYREVEWPQSVFAREERVKDFVQAHRARFQKDLGQEVAEREMEWLVGQGFSASLENIFIRSLSRWSEGYLVNSKSKIFPPESALKIISVVPVSDQSEEFTVSIDELRDFRKKSEFLLEGIYGIERFDEKQRKWISRLALNFMVPNLLVNLKETEERRARARETVLPVQISIKKNQMILRSGDVVQPTDATILAEIESMQTDRPVEFMAFISAILFVVSILVFFSYLRRFTLNKVKVSLKDISVMAVVTIFVIVLTKVFLFMTNSTFIHANVPTAVFMYAAPVAAGPMLVGLLITAGEVVWLFTIFMAAALALMVDQSFSFMFVTIVGGIAAARGVFNCKKRNDIYFAGLRTGLINFVVIALLTLMTSDKGDWAQEILWNATAGFAAGVFSAILAMAFVPLLESVFNYTTDVKLLELSNLNHPLMRDLMMKAPGTYHHCMAVGTMVEGAANEIGANALLAKVMAMYHDIGKMEHAQYFVENQSGFNPHDHISPYMSKTILVAHVKDGAEMGMRYKLGEPIIDGILQHHGTSLINYFYNRAVEEQDEHNDHVDENEFRYPGPKPQFKEAALVMLADSIEATARSLDEPTPARLQNIVKNIIQSKFIDGQLDECNLTLKDLSVIEDNYRRILLSIYHQRMEYPHMRDGKLIEVPKDKSKKTGPHTA